MNRKGCDFIDKSIGQTARIFLNEQCPTELTLFLKMIREELNHSVTQIILEICSHLLCFFDTEIETVLITKMIIVIQYLDTLITGKRNNLCTKFNERFMNCRL